MPPPPPISQPEPMPEAVAVHLLAIPDSAPPYDDDRNPPSSMNASDADHASPAGPLADTGTPDGHTPASGPAAGDSPADGAWANGGPAGGASLAGGTTPEDSTAPDEPGLLRPASPRPPDAGGAWAGQFAQVLAETLAGSRAQGQIVPWTNDQARRRIRQLGPMLAAGTVPRVRRVMTTCPAAGVVEMTVIVGFGPRVHALAVRLERDGPRHRHAAHHAGAPRWVCTAIEAA